MVKWFLRILIIVLFSICTSSFGVHFSQEYFNTMFTVLGIMFSVALSQVLTFSFTEVTNEDFVKKQRQQLKNIQNIFIVLFAVLTMIFLCSCKDIIFIKIRFISLSTNNLFGVFNLFCIYYFIRNFIALVNLKNEIDDRIRKVNRDKK